MTNDNQNFIEAVRLAAQSLRDSIRYIDDLNGRLEELEHYPREVSVLSDKGLDAIQDAHRMYVDLPVWDTLESLAERLEEVVEEVKEGDE